ncbi:hypothetical protein NIES2104_44240 [Leptolyngbya sp. NIES-2104]|nr:hypothetical protein NIES2104_44240 [Leptolyngbya sp. NIES-2104]
MTRFSNLFVCCCDRVPELANFIFYLDRVSNPRNLAYNPANSLALSFSC